MKVLIVEDNEVGRLTLTALIEGYGHEVEAYDNAEDALKRILKDGIKFDRVVCDMMLPGMNGLDFLMVLRRHHFSRNLKFVMISAYRVSADLLETDLQAACAQEGAKYVSKYFDVDEFVEKYIGSWPINGPKT